MKLLSRHVFYKNACLLLSCFPLMVQGQITLKWSTNAEQTIRIDLCSGPNRLPATTAQVPETITGLPVTAIGPNAFGSMNYFITNIVVPDSVTQVGSYAFWGCRYVSSITVGTGVTNLSDYAFAQIGNGVSLATYPAPQRVSFFFAGNAPTLISYSTNGVPTPDTTVFDSDPKATVYYLPGTSGWSNTFGGLPTAPWLPQIKQISGSSKGGLTQIALSVSWAKGKTVVIECSNDLLKQVWQPVATNILATGTWTFTGTQGPGWPCAYYRARAQ